MNNSIIWALLAIQIMFSAGIITLAVVADCRDIESGTFAGFESFRHSRMEWSPERLRESKSFILHTHRVPAFMPSGWEEENMPRVGYLTLLIIVGVTWSPLAGFLWLERATTL